MGIRVAIVEDRMEIRKGLMLLVDGSEGYECRHAWSSGEEAVLELPAVEVDVVLMDIHLPGMSGVEVVRKLKPQLPRIQFLMCTVYEEDEFIFESLKAGATGYILKNTPPVRLLEAIQEIHRGGSPMTGQIARKVISAFAPQPPSPVGGDLSRREREILQALAEGQRYKEIADRFFISLDTVRSHVRKIYEKLQVHSRTDALNKAFPRNR
jgi:DNA-binding NarL/FixJ family response regulator